MVRRGVFGLETFSLVTGGGKVGDSGGGLAYRFSCRLSRVEVTGVELLEELEEIEREVFRRSRIFAITYIDYPRMLHNYCQCQSQRLPGIRDRAGHARDLSQHNLLWGVPNYWRLRYVMVQTECSPVVFGVRKRAASSLLYRWRNT